MGSDLRGWGTVFSNEIANSSYRTHPYPRLQNWNFSDWIHTKVLLFHSNCFKHDVHFSANCSISPIHLILSVMKKQTQATFKTSFTWKSLLFNPHPADNSSPPRKSKSTKLCPFCSMKSCKRIIPKTILGLVLDPQYSRWGLNPLLSWVISPVTFIFGHFYNRSWLRDSGPILQGLWASGT